MRRSTSRRRNVAWWSGIIASFAVALFLFLPDLAAVYIERQAEAFGFKNVNVVLGYPGMHQIVIPLVSLEKDLESETARVTMRNVTLAYQFPHVLEGWLNEMRIEDASLTLTQKPADPSEPLTSDSSIAAVTTLLAQPLPHLPIRQLSLNGATIVRERATGPFRELTISGVLYNESEALRGLVTFQGMEGTLHTLHVTRDARGTMKMVLYTGESDDLILDVESTIAIFEQTGFHWQGSLYANIKRLSPSLALLMPLGPDVERVDGNITVQWEGKTARTGSIQTMLQDPSTRLHAVYQAAVELPAWDTIGEDVSMRLSGEVDASSTEVALTLSPASYVHTLLHPREFSLPSTPFAESFKEPESVELQVQEEVLGRFSLDPNDPQWNLDGPIRVHYGVEHSPVWLDAVVTHAAGPLGEPFLTDAEVQWHLRGVVPVFEQQPIKAKKIRWNVTGETTIHDQGIHLKVGKGSFVKTGQLHVERRIIPQVEVQVTQPVPVLMEWSSNRWEIGPTVLHVGVDRSRAGLDAVVTHVAGRLGEPFLTDAEVQWHLRGAWPVFEQQPIKAKDIRWNVTGETTIQDQIVHLKVKKGSSVKTGQLHVERGIIPQVEVQVSHPVPVSIEWSSNRWKIGSTVLQVTLPRIHWKDKSMTIEKMGVHVEGARGRGNEWNAKGIVKWLGLSAELKNVNPPKTNLAIGFDADSTGVKAGLVAETVNESVKIVGRLAHDFMTKRGSVRATVVPQPFSAGGGTFSQLIPDWEYPFDLTAGRLELSTRMTWHVDEAEHAGKLKLSDTAVTIAARDLGGYYENVVIEGINATVNGLITGIDTVAPGLVGFTMPVPTRVSVGRLDSGVEIKNVALTVQLDLDRGKAYPTLAIKDLSGHVFGGRISSSRISIDPSRFPSVFTIQLHGLQLDQLFKLEQQQGLQGIGVLDGNVPLRFDGETLTIRNGNVAVRPPGGVIRFEPLEETAQILAAATPQMDLVLRALKNFQYDVLRTGVEYREDGTLFLDARLEGKNPDMKQSPPIHLNLTVEENIPALLKSVQVVKGIEEHLEQVFEPSLF